MSSFTLPFSIFLFTLQASFLNPVNAENFPSFHAPLSSLVGPELNLAKYVDVLPIPENIDLKTLSDPLPIQIRQFKQSFHRDLPATPLWGYNGVFPGPTLIAEKNQESKILWQSELPKVPLLVSSSGMNLINGLPAVRTVVHLHGGSLPEIGYSDRQTNADGWPDSWSVPGQSQLAIYPNTQEASTLWYHDHSIGVTALNVYSGLAGAYLVRDDFERSLHLPSGKYEVPLIFQSRSFNRDGTLFYPKSFPTEFYGNVNTVNGKVWPYFVVEPRKYRFRMLNGANSRSYALKLLDSAGGAGPAFFQIGSDGGFLENTVVLNDPRDPNSKRLDLAPGERADVVIDFSAFAGKNLYLNNNSQTDDEALEPPIPEVMLFKVKAQSVKFDRSVLPLHFRPIERLKESDSRRARSITLQEFDSPNGRSVLLLNHLHWEDPIQEKPLLNSIETWNIVNATDDTHPFHVHLVQFQTVSRQPFDRPEFERSGRVVFTGPPVLPEPNEMGWKDTIKARSAMVTKIIMRFGPYPGHFVYHCHILEHEDMDMMRPFEVVTDEADTDHPQVLKLGLARFFSLIDDFLKPARVRAAQLQ